MTNYNSNSVKRRAYEIGKALQIPHHKALDQAAQEAGFQNWLHCLNSDAPLSRTIQPGTLVRYKDGNLLAIAITNADEQVKTYTHRGTLTCVRWEIAVCRDQTQATTFRPMRLVLPYGKWTCADRTEVFFNRDYRPIWKKQPDNVVVPADPDEWIRYEQHEHFFGDHNYPDEDRNSYRICMEKLRNWGVEHRDPVMLQLFRQAVAAGDLDLMKKRSIYD